MAPSKPLIMTHYMERPFPPAIHLPMLLSPSCPMPPSRPCAVPQVKKIEDPPLQKVGCDLEVQLCRAVQAADVDVQRGEASIPPPTLQCPSCMLRQRLTRLVIVTTLRVLALLVSRWVRDVVCIYTELLVASLLLLGVCRSHKRPDALW